MLSQEFSLPDVLTLWDALLTDESRTSLLINICCSMVCLTRDSILNNDFASNMKLLQVILNTLLKLSLCNETFSSLQNYPEIDMRIILAKAEELEARIM